MRANHVTEDMIWDLTWRQTLTPSSFESQIEIRPVTQWGAVNAGRTTPFRAQQRRGGAGASGVKGADPDPDI